LGSVFNRGTRDRPNWYGKYKDHDGRWKTVPTGKPTKLEARRWIEEAEGRISDGKVGVEAPVEEMTFDALADYWLENHSAAACVSHDDNISRMKHLRAAFGKDKLGRITAQRIDELKAQMARKKRKAAVGGTMEPHWQPATINRVVALLRKVMNDAVRWGYIAAAPRVKMLPVPEHDFDYLHREEAERFLSWAREHAPQNFPLYATAIYTGARMGELYGLQWSDADLEQGVITLRRSYQQNYTKSKKVRRVRTNRELALILKEWRLVCPMGELVFPVSSGEMRPRERPPLEWEAHLAGAGCRAIRFHDLRHTAASLMVMAGVSLRTVQQMLGHSTVQVTERYAHLAPDFMATEADRLSLSLGQQSLSVSTEGG
jgi:integrase